MLHYASEQLHVLQKRQDIKTTLQDIISRPNESTVVRKLGGQALAGAAKTALPANEWPDLLIWLHDASKSPDAVHRELALMVFTSLMSYLGAAFVSACLPSMDEPSGGFPPYPMLNALPYPDTPNNKASKDICPAERDGSHGFPLTQVLPPCCSSPSCDLSYYKLPPLHPFNPALSSARNSRIKPCMATNAVVTL